MRRLCCLETMPNLTRMANDLMATRLRLAAVAALTAAGLALAAAPAASADDVDAFAGSWLDSAMRAQYDLGSDLAFKNAPLIGTHNSFNSVEELGPSASSSATNQSHDLTDQLDFGVRSLELDLHPDPNAGVGDERPVVCHTVPRLGCTVVAAFDPFLSEIAGWLERSSNADQVVLLYLEDDLGDLALHDAAASSIERELGDLVYRPEDAGCNEISGDLTREEVAASGAQVVIVSGCGTGSAWQSLAFSWERHLESRPNDFADYPDCGPNFRMRQYRSRLVRYYEDATREAGSGGADDGLTPETTATMARCGVDLLGFDRLEPFDGRLEASIWSWAANEPSAGRCALIRAGRKLPFGRWVSKRCDGLTAPPACRNRNKWSVGKRRLELAAAKRYCRRRGAKLAVPRTGFENQLLRAAMKKRRTNSALLGYKLRRGEWVPLDSR